VEGEVTCGFVGARKRREEEEEKKRWKLRVTRRKEEEVVGLWVSANMKKQGQVRFVHAWVTKRRKQGKGKKEKE
jgi:hypothetical protein